MRAEAAPIALSHRQLVLAQNFMPEHEFFGKAGVDTRQPLLEQVFRLRFDVYSRIRVINPGDYPDGKVQDIYDTLDTTYHVVVLERGEVLGAGRIVQASEHGLSVYSDFPLSHYLSHLKKSEQELSPLGEGSRLVVSPRARNRNIGTYLQYIAPKFAFDVLGVKNLLSVGNPGYRGTFLCGCRPLGAPVSYRIVPGHGQSSRTKPQHSALAMYLTKELLTEPDNLVHHTENCCIVRPAP